jgi:hypothetical protein
LYTPPWHERPGLVAGWREREQIETNDRMLRNLLDRAAQLLAGNELTCRLPVLAPFGNAD